LLAVAGAVCQRRVQDRYAALWAGIALACLDRHAGHLDGLYQAHCASTDAGGAHDRRACRLRRGARAGVVGAGMSLPVRKSDGTIYQRLFGGHSANFGEKSVQRACASADRTGHSMLHTLYQRNLCAHTQFFVEWMALDLIRDADGDVLGVTALEMETGEVMILQAKATLFATGGAGRIFAASTNAFINTGDGLGMAARAGIPLQDMEFWQFHPTGVAGAGVLITEGVRGEGGILLNASG